MMIKSIILVGFWMFLVPIVLGLGILKLDKKGNKNVCLALILGLFTELLVFSMLAIPMTFLKCTFSLLKNSWAVIMIILSTVSIFFNRKNIKDIVKQNVDEIKGLPKILTVIFIILLAVQCYFPFKYMHEDYDDSNFVAKAVIAVDTDTLFVYDDAGNEYKEFPMRTVLSQFPHYTGTIAVLSNIHPTVLAHTVFPVVFIVIAYSFFYVFGKSLFKNDQKKTMIFLNLLAVIYMFGDYSRYTNFVRLLYRAWQGKSLVANLTIPFIWYVFIEYIGKENSKFGWMILGLCLAGSITFSSMAFILPPMMIAILMLLYAIKDKKKEYVIALGVLLFLAIIAVTICLTLDNPIAYDATLVNESLSIKDKVRIFAKEIGAKENFELIKEAYDRAGGGKHYFALFTIAVLFIMLRTKNENKDILFAVAIYSIVVMIINLNPVFSKLWSWALGEETYWRVYWILPIGYTVAYVLTECVLLIENTKNQIFTLIFCVIILMLNGNWVYTKINFVEVANYYKIPDHLLEMLFTIQVDEEGLKKVAGPEELIIYARQLDGNFVIEMERAVNGYYPEQSILKLMFINELEQINNMIENNNFNFIIFNVKMLSDGRTLTEYNYEEIHKNDTYVLYKKK